MEKCLTGENHSFRLSFALNHQPRLEVHIISLKLFLFCVDLFVAFLSWVKLKVLQCRSSEETAILPASFSYIASSRLSSTSDVLSERHHQQQSIGHHNSNKFVRLSRLSSGSSCWNRVLCRLLNWSLTINCIWTCPNYCVVICWIWRGHYWWGQEGRGQRCSHEKDESNNATRDT